MTRAEIDTELRAIVARTFGVDASELSDSTTAQDVDGWNSLAHATLLMRIEKRFNTDLDRAAATGAQDLGALAVLIARSLGIRHA